MALAPVVAALAELLGDSAHLEFLLRWVHALCVAQGQALQVRCPMCFANKELCAEGQALLDSA